ncbi:helix-turn-helix domain-containing protein [bacterium]|nr:helix-turn-helix domain-containing protein [bacterium]
MSTDNKNPSKKTLPAIVTTQEAADELRVHRSTISRLAKSGKLKSYVIGNRRLFKLEEVLSFFDNQVACEYLYQHEET